MFTFTVSLKYSPQHLGIITYLNSHIVLTQYFPLKFKLSQWSHSHTHAHARAHTHTDCVASVGSIIFDPFDICWKNKQCYSPAAAPLWWILMHLTFPGLVSKAACPRMLICVRWPGRYQGFVPIFSTWVSSQSTCMWRVT